MTEYLSAEDILGADDLDTKEVTISTWVVNGQPLTFTIRVLSMEEVLKANDKATIITKVGGKQESYVDQLIMSKELVRLAVVQPAFTGEQIDRLFKKKAGNITALVAEINALNNIGQEDAVEKATDQFQDRHAEVQPVLPRIRTEDDGATAPQANALS